MNVGIMGAGRIAALMAQTLHGISDEAFPYAIASRSQSKAEHFAAANGILRAYGSYEAMVADPAVDLVYIATPHSEHSSNVKLCLDEGKPVLCEKAFTQNASQAREVIALAEQKHILLAEAMWPRYMPSRSIIGEAISSGIVGKVTMLSANLHYLLTDKERLVKKELAGGALLDVGVYPIDFALMHFGPDVERVDSSVQFYHTGVDACETMTLFWRDGRVAALSSGMLSRSDRKGIFYGEAGYIVVENINNPQSVSAFDDEDRLIKEWQLPAQVTGYEYEVLECKRCLEQGLVECPSMPHKATVQMMEITDSLRRRWHLVYPGAGEPI